MTLPMRTMLLATILAGGPVASVTGQTWDQTGTGTVEDLIHLLASKDYKQRERATSLLVERRDAAAALTKALQSEDLEVRSRAGAILKESGKRQKARMLQRLKALASDGAVDQMTELLAQWPAGFEETSCWNEVCKVAESLLMLHQKQLGNSPSKGFRRDSAEGPKVVVGNRVAKVPHIEDKDYFLRAGGVDLDGVLEPIIAVSSGRFSIEFLGHGGAIFANGPVDVGHILGHRDTVIVSDSDLKVTLGASALIIARGTVTCDGPCGGCNIISGKKLAVTARGKLFKCLVTEYEPEPLGLVKWFDPAREGVQVGEAQGGVRVKAADADKPFAQAELLPGDLVTAVDGQAVDSFETFRRLVRRGLASPDGFTLRVVRDGQNHDLWVECPW